VVPTLVLFLVLVFGFFFVLAQVRSIGQSNVAVVTMFGKYRRLMREGLNFKLPWEAIYQKLSLQNRALQMEFQAITRDQANVKFSTMVVYAVANAGEDTIQRAVFSFASYQEFQLALQRTIDGSIRQFVATTLQADILAMRAEIVDHTKRTLDEVVSSWGYVVRDIQITDMTFDKEIMDSMARVVSSKNLLAAAANEGAALLVKRTKDAEAEAAYKTIGAEAEKKAAALRGEGLALFRRNIAEGMKEAAANLAQAGVDSNFLLFLEYTDALKYVSDHSQGKIIFMDNGAGAAGRVAQQIGAFGFDPDGGGPTGHRAPGGPPQSGAGAGAAGGLGGPGGTGGAATPATPAAGGAPGAGH
jgi:regulator of protease activity HflC (stomatin/prohibitin superfamily)